MTVPVAPTTPRAPASAVRDEALPGPAGTRLGAACGVASIALLLAGVALIASAGATFHSPDAEVLRFYEQAGPARTVAGGLVQALGLLLLLPFAAMLAGRVARPGPAAEVLAPTARMAATVYVAVCLAPGLAAGAAALWLARAGTVDPGVVVALNDVRSLSYFLALLAFAAFLCVVGAAGLVSGGLARWASWSAVVLGLALAASVPTAALGLADVAGLLGLVWVVAVCVSLLRAPAADRPATSDS